MKLKAALTGAALYCTLAFAISLWSWWSSVLTEYKRERERERQACGCARHYMSRDLARAVFCLPNELRLLAPWWSVPFTAAPSAAAAASCGIATESEADDCDGGACMSGGGSAATMALMGLVGVLGEWPSVVVHGSMLAIANTTSGGGGIGGGRGESGASKSGGDSGGRGEGGGRGESDSLSLSSSSSSSSSEWSTSECEWEFWCASELGDALFVNELELAVIVVVVVAVVFVAVIGANDGTPPRAPPEVEVEALAAASFSRRRRLSLASRSRSAAFFSRNLRSRTLKYSPSICRNRSGLSRNESATSINWSASNCGMFSVSSLLVNLRKVIKPSKSILTRSAVFQSHVVRDIFTHSFISIVASRRERRWIPPPAPSKTLKIANATAYKKSKSRLKNESQMRSATPNGKLYMKPAMKN